MQKLILSIILGIVGASIPLSARAEDKDYCTRMREHAIADKVLALSPTLEISAIRYPAPNSLTSIVGGSISSDGFQTRGSISYDLLNAYRGTLLTPLADADCKQHSLQTEAQNLLEQAVDIGRATALLTTSEFLTTAQPDWQAIVGKTEQRVSAGTITLGELTIIRTNANNLEMKFANIRGQLGVLQAKDYVKQARPVSEIVAQLQTASMEFESKASKLRMLDPWELSLSGGVIPPLKQVDNVEWYGALTVGYKFGGFVRATHERNYLAARASELQHARYELTDMLRRMTDGVHANLQATNDQIGVLEARMLQLENTHSELSSHSDAKSAANLMALIELQQIDAMSDMVFLEELKRELVLWQ
jgi:hypothetical protein